MALDKGLIIDGTEGADELTGTSHNDIIDGRGGADRLVGGAGHDIYLVENSGDLVIERPAHGTDEVRAAINYMLPANVENLTLLVGAVNGFGNELDNVIIGNDVANILRGVAGNDLIFGNGGNDFLDGGVGADTLDGGSGNDVYLVDSALDVVVEHAGAGIDRVISSVDHVLAQDVENLSLVGAAVNGTGNSLSNQIIGNAAANVLDGREGNDVLNGGPGADTMIGGAGNDAYMVDNVGDSVEELAGEGYDRIFSSVDYELPANFEVLILTGSVAVSASGNELNNRINGNGADNLLAGGAGNDVLAGLGGNDTLDGGAGNDNLWGGVGNDILIGGEGSDHFIFNTAPNPSTNVDTISDFAETDTILLMQSIFSGLDRGSLDPSAFHAGTTAADADDRIIYDSTTGALYYDADGDGAAAQQLFAYVTPGTDMTAGDFFVVA